jgi:hypothetical protein
MVGLSVGVHVLHLVLADVCLLDFILGTETVIDLIAGTEVSKFDLHHGPEVPRGVVIKLEHFAKLAVETDYHASAEIVRLHETVNSFR